MKKAIIFACILTLAMNFGRCQSSPWATFDASATSMINFGPASDLSCYDALPLDDKLTITMWVRWNNKSASGVGSWANLFTMADSSGNGDNGVWWVQHNSNNSYFEFALHTTSRSYIFSTTTPVDGVWYHLALRYTGSQMEIYVNGILENAASKSGNLRSFPALNKLMMGRWAHLGNGGRKFNGSMDEISIWNRDLSVAEINTMMSSPEAITGMNYDTTGILGYWNFSNGTADDLTPCGNNGVIGQAVTLPVELINFSGNKYGNQVVLNWTTASEINNDFFTIERSINGIRWETITLLAGKGNSSSETNYEYIDWVHEKLNTEDLLYYRISQTDFNGVETRKKTIAVKGKPQQMNVNISPNPCTDRIQILTTNTSGIQQINLSSSNGRLISTKNYKGGSTWINTNHLLPGMYFIQLNLNEEVVTEKIIVQ